MSETTFNQRTADLAAIWRDNRWLYLLAGFALGLLALPAAQMVNSETFALLTGLVPEAVGITFTVLIVERLARSRAERELKEQLIFELGSEDNSTARRALRLLKHRGWDKDGSLRGANLREADLTGAKMRGAELQGAILVNASLKDAELVGANLIGATLDNANLEEADMGGTNLEMASLCRANMHGASLLHSNLRGASMSMSILEKAN
ncbi:MAG: pentapeptide repeat-containing protein, partial [Chloroflexota bacterium]